MTSQPLRQAHRRRIGVAIAIVGGGTVAAMSLAALAFQMVSSAWTF